MSFRSGFVSIIGRPNAGKSTLLNALVGEKVAIVTYKPQTTRNRIQGFVNVAAKKGRPGGQIIFIDTPGVHKPDTALNRKLLREVHDALEARDLTLLIVDTSQNPGAADRFTLEMVKKAGGPVILLLNKIDLVEKGKLLPIIAQWNQQHDFKEIIPISAMKKDGLELLLDKVIANLPEGPRYFPKDQVTDQPERFLAAEIVREKVLFDTSEEVPYATAVMVERFEEEPKITRIAATIYVERDGQKKIVVGKGGEMIKRIGTEARIELEKVLGVKIFLELFVKVRPGWRESRQFLEELDWQKQLEGLATAEEPEDER
jgi:GTPase